MLREGGRQGGEKGRAKDRGEEADERSLAVGESQSGACHCLPVIHQDRAGEQMRGEGRKRRKQRGERKERGVEARDDRKFALELRGARVRATN